MNATTVFSGSDLIRKHGADFYVSPARRRGDKTFTINAGDVHRSLGLQNLVPSVCNALKSKKFLSENRLRLVDRSGPRSGMSTTVTYRYEFLDVQVSPPVDPWLRLRGALKDVFAELGGAENYLRKERDQFHRVGEEK